MKILLIFPSWTSEYGIFSYFAKRASTWPPLNLAYIAALAEKEGHTVKIIDGEAEGLSVKKIIMEKNAFKPDIIGMTATTPFFHLAVELAEKLKEDDASIPIIIGGSHITILKDQAFFPSFDYACIGESEKSWPQFLACLERGGDISTIKGLLYRKGKEVIFTGLSETVEDLDTIPFPARHLLKTDKYLIGTLQGRKKFATVITTRGCPFKCVFCSTKIFGFRVRRRSVRSVVDEIKSVISEFNITHFIFLDDTFTLSRKYVIELCDLMEKEGVSITFECGTRANLIDEELVKVMVKNGLKRISYGLETVDPEVRKLIRKEVPLECYSTANRITNKYGVETLNSVMLGLPGETRETVQKTLDFLRSAREISQANFSIAMPYPGTELFDMAKNKQHGLKLLTEDFSKYRRYGSVVTEVNDLSAQDLLRLQNDGFVSIYSAPWRIVPMLRKSGFLGGLLMLFRVASKVSRDVLAKAGRN